jgi:hypothetical protein
MNRDGAELEVTQRLKSGTARIDMRVRCVKFSRRGNAGARTTDASFELEVSNARTSTRTLMKGAVRWVNAGASCWLNLQANPTSLIIGTNALAVALGHQKSEELRLFRIPFFVLQQVLRAADPGFKFSKKTRGRIRSGEIALHNVQLAMYLPMDSRAELRFFLNWLYATFCTPIVLPNWETTLLGEYLGLRVDWRLGPDARPTGVMFWRRADKDHALITVNFYDKLVTLSDQERALLGGQALDWLGQHLRLARDDLTLRRHGCDQVFQLGTDEDGQFVAALARQLGGSAVGAFLVTPVSLDALSGKPERGR